ncbi:MAG TPA: carbohydrate ABC transporter permease [Acidimicrobiales bacterium]|nr:carbohydrate ABC transporter permease [Acidimicrobiales bacterium]
MTAVATMPIEQQRRRAQRRYVVSRIVVYAVAIVASLLAAFPFIVEGIITFKRDQDLYAPGNNPFVYNLDPTTEHLDYLFTSTGFLTFVGNTLLVGGCVVAITLLLALPAAYSLARLPLRWGGALGITIFLVYLIPPSLLFVSFSRLVADLGLQNSRWALVVLYPTITVPVSVWLLLGFFKSIPRDIEEQAMVDGYSRLAAFTRVAVPLAFPGIVAVVVFAFTLSTHEFLYASAFLSSSGEKTVSVGIPTELVLGDVFHWQELQAAALLVALPIALVFSLLLNRFVSGFTMGAVKG